jgi:hypothetical protein
MIDLRLHYLYGPTTNFSALVTDVPASDDMMGSEKEQMIATAVFITSIPYSKSMRAQSRPLVHAAICQSLDAISPYDPLDGFEYAIKLKLRKASAILQSFRTALQPLPRG